MQTTPIWNLFSVAGYNCALLMFALILRLHVLGWDDLLSFAVETCI
jgi:hypothetical protein